MVVRLSSCHGPMVVRLPRNQGVVALAGMTWYNSGTAEVRLANRTDMMLVRLVMLTSSPDRAWHGPVWK